MAQLLVQFTDLRARFTPLNTFSLLGRLHYGLVFFERERVLWSRFDPRLMDLRLFSS